MAFVTMEKHRIPTISLSHVALPHSHGAEAIPSNVDLAHQKRLLEESTILQALEKSAGNIAMAAKNLSMSRQLLSYKIKKIKPSPPNYIR